MARLTSPTAVRAKLTSAITGDELLINPMGSLLRSPMSMRPPTPFARVALKLTSKPDAPPLLMRSGTDPLESAARLPPEVLMDTDGLAIAVLPGTLERTLPCPDRVKETDALNGFVSFASVRDSAVRSLMLTVPP